jgi:hypothetical protein
LANPELTGRANFGFVSKYKKGKSVPDGNTEFQFHAVDINFHSTSYDWLVIAGHKAMYKGTGIINGDGNFGFQLSAIDADLTPSTDIDLFRIRIWDKDNNDALVYDNKVGESDPNADPSTALGGGNIKIHQQKGLNKPLSESIIREIPFSYSVSQNYPNPFNPSTIFSYDLPLTSRVEIIIYNMLGQVVERSFIKSQPAGQHQYTFNAAELSGGMYFYCIQARSLDGIETQSFQQIKKMIYLK